MNDKSRLNNFIKSLDEPVDSDYDSLMVTTIFYIEKELGCYIDGTYPFTKFWQQWLELKKHYEREKAEYDKMNRK